MDENSNKAEKQGSSGRKRAPAMEAGRRREMIVSAALPLVVEYGAAVTTAQIARAAGIGEGTIFRVFSDKDELLAACMDAAVRPDDTVAHLEAIVLEQPLEERLHQACEVLRGHMNRIGQVAGALAAVGKLDRMRRPEAGAKGEMPDREAGLAGPRAALAALFEPDRDALRQPPERLAAVFQMMLLASGRPGTAEPLDNDELVGLFLHGAVRAPGAPEGGA